MPKPRRARGDETTFSALFCASSVLPTRKIALLLAAIEHGLARTAIRGAQHNLSTGSRQHPDKDLMPAHRLA
jgi:hypothetical protein